MLRKLIALPYSRGGMSSENAEPQTSADSKKTLSIYRIHSYFLFRDSGVKGAMPEQVKAFMRQYNERAGGRFELQLTPEFEPKHNHGFQLLAYQEAVESRGVAHSFLTSLGAAPQSKWTTRYLFFYIRGQDGFVVPSGSNSWRVIAHICDYSFPLKITRRLLDPSTITKDTKFQFFGPTTSTQSSHRESRAISELARHAQVKMFSTFFRENSSLYQVFGLKHASSTGVELGTRYVKFNTGLAFGELPQLFHHFSQILAKGKTFLSDEKGAPTKDEEIDQKEFDVLDRIRITDDELIKILDNQLAQKVIAFCESEYKDPISLTIAPEHEFSFQSASSYRLNRTGLDIEFADKPTLKDVLARLYVPGMSEADLLSLLKETKLSFDCYGMTTEVSIYNALRGEINYEGNPHYLIAGVYFPGEKLQLDTRFSQLISRILISPEHIAQLEDWPIGIHEGPYNESFLAHFYDEKVSPIGHLVSDRILVEGCELFDIARITPDTIYLYAVKEGLNAGAARAVCGQLREAMSHFRHDRTQLLEGLWKSMTAVEAGTDGADYRAQVKEKVELLGGDAFKALFDRKIIFVVAMGVGKSKSKSKDEGEGEGKDKRELNMTSFLPWVTDSITDSTFPNFCEALKNWITRFPYEPHNSKIFALIANGSKLEKIKMEDRKAIATALIEKFPDFVDEFVDGLAVSDANKVRLKTKLRKAIPAKKVFLSGHKLTILGDMTQIDSAFQRVIQSLKPSNDLQLELLSLADECLENGFDLRLCQIERSETEAVVFGPRLPVAPTGVLASDWVRCCASLSNLRSAPSVSAPEVGDAPSEAVVIPIIFSPERFNRRENIGGGDCLYHALEGRDLTVDEVLQLRADVAEQLPLIRPENQGRNAMELAMLMRQSLGDEGQSFMKGVPAVPNHVYQDFQKMPGMYAGDDEILQYCRLKKYRVFVVDEDGKLSRYTETASEREAIKRADTLEADTARIREALEAGDIVLYKTSVHFERIMNCRPVS